VSTLIITYILHPKQEPKKQNEVEGLRVGGEGEGGGSTRSQQYRVEKTLNVTVAPAYLVLLVCGSLLGDLFHVLVLWKV
jgi:hypothetical protein